MSSLCIHGKVRALSCQQPTMHQVLQTYGPLHHFCGFVKPSTWSWATLTSSKYLHLVCGNVWTSWPHQNTNDHRMGHLDHLVLQSTHQRRMVSNAQTTKPCLPCHQPFTLLSSITTILNKDETFIQAFRSNKKATKKRRIFILDLAYKWYFFIKKLASSIYIAKVTRSNYDFNFEMIDLIRFANQNGNQRKGSMRRKRRVAWILQQRKLRRFWHVGHQGFNLLKEIWKNKSKQALCFFKSSDLQLATYLHTIH